jgi:hypothetical protein
VKPKPLILLLVLAAMVCGASLYLYRRQAADWGQEAAFNGGKILDFPINDVAAVTIKGPSGEVNLTKQNNAWLVKERDYPADLDHVSRLIRTLWDLRAVQDVTAAPSQLPRLHLAVSGTLTDLKNAQGKRLAALMAGKDYLKSNPDIPGSGYPAGRYVMPLDGSSRVALVDDTLPDINASPADWLDRTFIQIHHIKSVTVSGTTPQTQWKIERPDEKSAWTLAGAAPGERLEPSKVPNYESLLGSPVFTDVLPKSGSGQYPVAVKVETFDGSTCTLKLGAPREDKWPVLLEVTGKLDKAKQWNGRVFLLPRITVSGLIKDRSQMLARNPPPPAIPIPAAHVPRSPVTTPPVAAPLPH